MRLWRPKALMMAISVGIVLIFILAVILLAGPPPGKLSADATLVNLAGMCPQGFSRTITLSNDGGQPVHWQAPALEEAGVTDVRIAPATGTLQPHARYSVQVLGHTLRGGFTLMFDWQGDPVNVQFSCNGPQ